MISVGQQVDEFHIEYLIGEGTFGSVFLAYDKLLDRPTAIKVLKEDFIQNSEILRRFLQEIHIVKDIFHPNIVSYYGYRRWGNNYCLLTEYIAGGNLR